MPIPSAALPYLAALDIELGKINCGKHLLKARKMIFHPDIVWTNQSACHDSLSLYLYSSQCKTSSLSGCFLVASEPIQVPLDKSVCWIDQMKKGLLKFWSTPSVAITGLLYFNYSVPAHGLQEYEMGSSSSIFTPLHSAENVLGLKRRSTQLYRQPGTLCCMNSL